MSKMLNPSDFGKLINEHESKRIGLVGACYALDGDAHSAYVEAVRVRDNERAIERDTGTLEDIGHVELSGLGDIGALDADLDIGAVLDDVRSRALAIRGMVESAPGGAGPQTLAALSVMVQAHDRALAKLASMVRVGVGSNRAPANPVYQGEPGLLRQAGAELFGVAAAAIGAGAGVLYTITNAKNTPFDVGRVFAELYDSALGAALFGEVTTFTIGGDTWGMPPFSLEPFRSSVFSPLPFNVRLPAGSGQIAATLFNATAIATGRGNFNLAGYRSGNRA